MRGTQSHWASQWAISAPTDLVAIDIEALVVHLNTRIAAEAVAARLLPEVEAALVQMREAYRRNPASFSPPTVAQLRRATDIATGLRLLDELVIAIGDISSEDAFRRIEGDLGTLSDLFVGMAVGAQVANAMQSLQDLWPMIAVLDAPASRSSRGTRNAEGGTGADLPRPRKPSDKSCLSDNPAGKQDTFDLS